MGGRWSFRKCSKLCRDEVKTKFDSFKATGIEGEARGFLKKGQHTIQMRLTAKLVEEELRAGGTGFISVGLSTNSSEVTLLKCSG